MSYYKCKKCGYQQNYFRDIKKHINIKKNCIIDFSCLELNNDEILIMSVIPYVNNKQDIDLSLIKNYKNTYKNKDLLFNDLSEIDKNKIKNCKYCNKSFTLIKDLKKHIIIECFENQMKNIADNNLNEINYINNYNIENTKIEGSKIENSTINNTTNNITNIIVNIENPLPFDDNWDITKISDNEKSHLMLSQLMYTHLLEEILKNNLNLNVIIDKNKEFGIVYKNDFKKYIKMEINEIISNSMEKLHNKLLDINNELKKNYFFDKNILDYKSKDIKNKYQCYINNEDTKKKVNEYITDIFDTKKDDSYELMKKILSNEITNNIENGY